MDVTFEYRVPTDVERAIMGLTNREAAKAMMMVSKKLVHREKLFAKHLKDGQSTWPANSEDYTRRKLKDGYSDEKFVRTGEAKRALVNTGEPSLKVWANAKQRVLRIGLRKMVRGVNVYRVAQLGKFRGVVLSDKSGEEHSLSAEETFEHNRKMNRAYYALSRAGKLSGVSRSSFTSRFGKTVSRTSDKERLITTVLPGDEVVAERVVREEIEITMNKRGF